MNYFISENDREDMGKGRHRKRKDGERVWQEEQIFKGINLRG